MKLFKIWDKVDDIKQIEPSGLKEIGIRLILFDFDNTLSEHKSKQIHDEVITYLQKLVSYGIDFFILSNAKKKRINKVLAEYGLKGRGAAYKPIPFILSRVIKKRGYMKDEVILVGDQLFTDIMAGNLAGIKTILVKQISSNEAFLIKIRRKIEDMLLGKKRENDRS